MTCETCAETSCKKQTAKQGKTVEFCSAHNDASPVISTTEIEFRRFDHPEFRWGKKVQVLTLGNIATYATVTPKNIWDFKGWLPVPKIPADMKADK